MRTLLRKARKIRAIPGFVLVLAACGGGGAETGGEPAAVARVADDPCSAFPTDQASRVALLQYMNDLAPIPRWFLNSVGTDSAVPASAFAALQAKGPTYFYPPADSAARAKLRQTLELVGPWTAMVVAWKGAQRLGDDSGVIRIRGHYAFGDGEGTSAPPRAVHFACRDSGWTFVRVEDEGSS
ncbi:MAG: hypothetical protein M3373_05515 [Gemmatimonadota bacterium]|nr:hypothetical protein [Gemmatimonadota bacterium]